MLEKHSNPFSAEVSVLLLLTTMVRRLPTHRVIVMGKSQSRLVFKSQFEPFWRFTMRCNELVWNTVFAFFAIWFDNFAIRFLKNSQIAGNRKNSHSLLPQEVTWLHVVHARWIRSTASSHAVQFRVTNCIYCGNWLRSLTDCTCIKLFLMLWKISEHKNAPSLKRKLNVWDLT